MLPGIILAIAARAGVPKWVVIGAAVLIAIVAFVGTAIAVRNSIWNSGYAAADAAWTAKALESKIKKLEQELEAARRSKESDDRNDAELEAERDELQKKVTAYEEARKK